DTAFLDGERADVSRMKFGLERLVVKGDFSDEAEPGAEMAELGRGRCIGGYPSDFWVEQFALDDVSELCDEARSNDRIVRFHEKCLRTADVCNRTTVLQRNAGRQHGRSAAGL